jgi:NAD(P)-dependent dehydrogenase (short-subunit alcohol dehydrogenase family)
MFDAMRSSVPVRRLGTPAAIGSVVAFLASADAGYVNGVNLPVHGGRLIALNT